MPQETRSRGDRMANQWTVITVSLCAAFTFALSTSLKHASASQLADRHEQQARPVRALHPDPPAVARRHRRGRDRVVAADRGAAPRCAGGGTAAADLRAAVRADPAPADAARRQPAGRSPGACCSRLSLAGFLWSPGSPTRPMTSAPTTARPSRPRVAGFVLAGVCLVLGHRQRSGGRGGRAGGHRGRRHLRRHRGAVEGGHEQRGARPWVLLTSWQLYAVIVLGRRSDCCSTSWPSGPAR